MGSISGLFLASHSWSRVLVVCSFQRHVPKVYPRNLVLQSWVGEGDPNFSSLVRISGTRTHASEFLANHLAGVGY